MSADPHRIHTASDVPTFGGRLVLKLTSFPAEDRIIYRTNLPLNAGESGVIWASVAGACVAARGLVA